MFQVDIDQQGMKFAVPNDTTMANQTFQMKPAKINLSERLTDSWN